jgi:hypothetical protein
MLIRTRHGQFDDPNKVVTEALTAGALVICVDTKKKS